VSRAARPADVRFYFDADVLGLAKALAPLRADLTYPGDPGAVVHRRRRPPCPIKSPSVKDSVWIPQVAALGWLIITRDARIQDHRAEIEAVRASGARMVVLGSREATTTWTQLELFMGQWRVIERLAGKPGPLLCNVTRTSVRAVPLQ